MRKKEIKKKGFSLCSMLLIVLLFFPINIYALSYNASAALSYASNNWNSDRPNDCSNFVSACLCAGGISINSPSVRGFYNALIEMGLEASSVPTVYSKHGLMVPYEGSDITPGDPVISYCPLCDKFLHTTLAAGVDKDGYLTVYAHSKKKNCERLYADHQRHQRDILVYVIHMPKTTVESLDNYSQPNALEINNTLFKCTGISAPDSICLRKGRCYGLKGQISCLDKKDSIQQITGQIVEQQTFNVIQESTFSFSNTKSIDIRKTINDELIFNWLAPGCYYYIVSVENASGICQTVICSEFEIVSVE